MEYREEDFLLLSGIQHFAFCRRQWALIHIEQQWAENVRTFEGKVMHENAHDPFLKEKRGDVITVRAMKIFSAGMGVSGECDVVEFHSAPQGICLQGYEGRYRAVPVEYKRGAPKSHDADELQLTAQAMCLEEMLQTEVERGYLYYGETRRRKEVCFSAEIRDKVRRYFEEMHGYYQRRYTPRVKPGPACKQCSLQNICMPELGEIQTVQKYIDKMLREDMS
ncbi:MAG: CRISPR-associated protein Cas4 [bacterium]|nr:CRISPR-associated protein Cas4 [bacterium]